MDSAVDAEFIFGLLNSPKFLQYIGDRGVRSVEDAADFIETRYRQSYREHGFGLYVVELCHQNDTDHTLPTGRVSAVNRKLSTGRVSALDAGTQVGICGFVKRVFLPAADIGFAFLPNFEGHGFGFESATAIVKYGRDTLGLKRVLAITSQDNDASVKLLDKLGFISSGAFMLPDGETVNLFEANL